MFNLLEETQLTVADFPLIGFVTIAYAVYRLIMCRVVFPPIARAVKVDKTETIHPPLVRPAALPGQ
jgi:hypothetical protein